MTTTTLEDLLTKDQLRALSKELARLKRNNIDPLDPAYTSALKALFRPWSEDLLAKGVVADYLAYVVSYEASKK